MNCCLQESFPGDAEHIHPAWRGSEVWKEQREVGNGSGDEVMAFQVDSAQIARGKAGLNPIL